MSEVFKLPVTAEQHARAETARKQELFEWGDGVLVKLGYTTRINFAGTVQELNQIIFNPNSVEVTLAIRDALHPATGEPRPTFLVGMNGASLKRLLATRFEELIKNRREALSRDLFGLKPGPHWSDDLVRGGPRNDTIRPILANFELILRESPKWKGVLAYNEFAHRVVICKPPPFETKADTWTDDAETQTRIFFQRHFDLTAGLGDLGRAIQSVARHSAFHPVRDYLNALVWDQTPRLATWLQTYFHAPDTPYMRAIGSRWLISGVARIFSPGCKADHCLVLEGPQGLFKSMSLQKLAIRPEWHTDRISAIGSKDALMEIAGVLIIELAELDAIKRAATSTSKSFLTSTHDRFRPPWGTHTSSGSPSMHIRG